MELYKYSQEKEKTDSSASLGRWTQMEVSRNRRPPPAASRETVSAEKIQNEGKRRPSSQVSCMRAPTKPNNKKGRKEMGRSKRSRDPNQQSQGGGEGAFAPKGIQRT